jgi:hypothetical protein
LGNKLFTATPKIPSISTPKTTEGAKIPPEKPAQDTEQAIEWDLPVTDQCVLRDIEGRKVSEKMMGNHGCRCLLRLPWLFGFRFQLSANSFLTPDT